VRHIKSRVSKIDINKGNDCFLCVSFVCLLQFMNERKGYRNLVCNDGRYTRLGVRPSPTSCDMKGKEQSKRWSISMGLSDLR
jgi:hypothetical protein